MARRKQIWKEVEFADVLGMATNPVNPGRKSAKNIQNLYTHEKPGAMMLRPGYELKYEAPSNTNIVNYGMLNFDHFYDRQAESTGQEVACLIQKGKVLDVDGQDVIDSQEMLCFWARPYWDGSAWVDEWEWINEVFITEIQIPSDATYPNMIKVYGNEAQGLGDDSCIGYTIWNKTQNQYAKIITCKTDGDRTRIVHTLYNSNWDTGDVVYISRSWFDITAMEANYTAASEDYSFHKILNDLRIGFGGYEGRLGAFVGYRKKYFLIASMDFTNYHPDIDPDTLGLIDPDILEAFCKTDRVVLDSFILNTDAYGIDLTATEAGTVPAGTYYFKLTGLMDGYSEQVIADNVITLDGTKELSIYPYLYAGIENPRITKYKLYYSTDNDVFYQIKEDAITGSVYNATIWKIDANGKIIFNFDVNAQLHTDGNAASTINETNSVGGWESHLSFWYGSLSSDSTDFAPMPDGSHCIKFENNTGSPVHVKLYSPSLSPTDQRLTAIVSFYGIASVTGTKLKIYSNIGLTPVPFGSEDYYNVEEVTLTDSWQEFQVTITLGQKITFELGSDLALTEMIGIDSLIVTPADNNFTELSAATVEMKTNIGYTPTYNLVKSWDQCIITKGRAYYLNPFIDKRYDNYLFYSPISPANGYMYDVGPASKYFPAERNDGNNTIGMALLPTNEILLLKTSSIDSIDPDTGASREPVFGVSCTSRESIVNMNGTILWCGNEDMYILNIGAGFNAKPLLKETIRDLYLAISDKELLAAIRDKYNTYRVRVYDVDNKTEYLLSENGWITEKKYHFPEIYRAAYDNRLNFLATGNIYTFDTEVDYQTLDDIIMSDEFVTDVEGS